MNGTIAIISIDNGKIIHSRICKPCHRNIEYETHRASCSTNYDGTYDEVEDRLLIVMYDMKYLADSDSKAYLGVKDTYKVDIVEKYQCVGHYQKRIGTRLRKLKKNTKGLKPLADAVIDKIQNYFGTALRANTGGTTQKMADAIWASFLHVASNKHMLCKKSSIS